MQKRQEIWNTFQCFIDGGGKPRERVKWPVAGPFERLLTSSEQFDKLRKLKKSTVVTVACVLILLMI
jgi:hypothetical protein